MILLGSRTVIFVDGCFWHGCLRCHDFQKDCNAYWLQKILTNRARDARIRRTLRRNGWQVIRIWEHDLRRKDQFARTVSRIERKLRLSDE